MVFLRVVGSPPKQEAGFRDRLALCRSGGAGENPHFERAAASALMAHAQIEKSLR
jgi:hypothetical protein